jgi:quinoprotein dehydrogenase-associated probable ABC transporter substrate-binding protein
MTSGRAKKPATPKLHVSGWPGIILPTLAGILACGLVALPSVAAYAQADSGSLELVDPNVFRACGDPRNLPFSNDTGFVRMTLGSYRCDIIMGFPQGDDQAQVTIPYYRTTYALVVRPGSGLEDVTAIDDPKLKDKRIGVVARTPPSTNMAMNGLLARAKSYPLFIDTRADSSAQAMMDDLARGDIDCGILWGPFAGYYAKQANPPLIVVPLTKETTGPQMTFRIGMAVRPADQEWKRTLNRLIMENQAEINKLLISFNIPILDEANMPITAETLSKRP